MFIDPFLICWCELIILCGESYEYNHYGIFHLNSQI